MKKFLILAFLSIGLASAQEISYQGNFSDGTGDAYNGYISVTARLLDSSKTIPMVWEEAHDSVLVKNSVYSIILGSKFSLSGVDFKNPYHLQLVVNNVISNPVPLSFVPYAVSANTVTGNVASTATIDSGLVVKTVNGIADDVTIAVDSTLTLNAANNVITVGVNQSVINNHISIGDSMVVTSINGLRDSVVLKGDSTIDVSVSGNVITVSVNQDKLDAAAWSQDSTGLGTDLLVKGHGFQFDVWRGDLPDCDSSTLGTMLLQTSETNPKVAVSTATNIRICLVKSGAYQWAGYTIDFTVP